MSDPTPNFLTCPAAPELMPPAGTEPASSAPPSPAGEPRPKRRLRLKWLVPVIILAFVVLFAPLVYGGIEAGLAARRVKQTLDSAYAKAQAQDFTGANRALDSLDPDLQQLRDGFRAMGWWRSMPSIGTQIRALEEIERVGESVLSGGRDLLSVASSIQDALASVGMTGSALETGVAPHRSFRDLSGEEKRSILARFSEAMPDLRVARDKIAIASDAWSRVPQSELYAPIRNALTPLAAQLPKLKTSLDQVVSLAEVAVPMLGYPNAQSYLILLQNADEIRPTGGFIGEVGTMTVRAGDLGHIEFHDVYAIDDPVIGKWTDVPPAPLKTQLGVAAWYLRDSNWSPDFPQSADRILDVYQREKALAGAPSSTYDGVIALQPDFFRRLLEMTGPITVDGKQFRADNFFDELQYDVEQGFLANGLPVQQRKEIVAKVGDALINLLMDRPSSDWPKMLDLFTTSLEHKDILLYDRNPGILSLLDARHWSGRIQPGAPDYVWVVDANLAALKTDGVMEKRVTYALDATASGGPTATVTLHYTNTNTRFDWRYTRYRDYVRVYVPEGSELISSNGAMLNDKTRTGGRVVPGTVDVTRDLGKTVFGVFWAIEPGETRDLSFTYRLPASVVANLQTGPYHLFVQKQPGSNTELTLDLLFGKNVTSASPPEAPKYFGDQRYQLSQPLDRDRVVDVTF